MSGTASADKRIFGVLRRWARSDSESVSGKLIRFPLRLIPNRAVVTVKSGINKGMRWVVGSSIHGCWLGTYESDKQALVAELTKAGMVVWDVGANAGFYTLAFARLVGSRGRVYAFEPFPENADNLLRHVRLNGLTNTTVVQAALGGHTGLVGFKTGPRNEMGSISAQANDHLVPLMSADDFVRQNPEARPDLLKIDVEGAESDLLSGAGELLRHAGPDILLALHGDEPARSCVDQLKEAGYEVRYLDGTSVKEWPLRSREVYARKEGATTKSSVTRDSAK